MNIRWLFKIDGGVGDMKTSFPGFHPTTDFRSPWKGQHIANDLILTWIRRIHKGVAFGEKIAIKRVQKRTRSHFVECEQFIKILQICTNLTNILDWLYDLN